MTKISIRFYNGCEVRAIWDKKNFKVSNLKSNWTKILVDISMLSPVEMCFLKAKMALWNLISDTTTTTTTATRE